MQIKLLARGMAIAAIAVTVVSPMGNLAAPVGRSAEPNLHFPKFPPGIANPLERHLPSRKQPATPDRERTTATPAPTWVKQLGTTQDDYSYDITTDRTGNVYITGWTDGKLSGQHYGYDDAWVAKYSPGGELQWKKQLGTASWDSSYGVATDGAGNVYITGYTLGQLGDQNYGRNDAWVAKYSPAGILKWIKQLGTAQDELSTGVATDGVGNVYVTGSTLGQLGNQNYGYYDVWVTKYGPAGKLKWTKQLGTSLGDFSYDIATDGVGNVYITGMTDGQLGKKHYGDFDAWVAKYSPTGVLQWAKQLGTATEDWSSDVAIDGVGNVYIAGMTNGQLGDQNYGDSDAWIAKYSPTGILKWTKQLGTNLEDFSTGVAVDGIGNVYITGYTLGQLGDQQYGFTDAWVARYRTGP